MRRALAVLGAVLRWTAFVVLAAFTLVYYVVPPLRVYNIFWLQNFDYGILYNSSQMLAYLQEPFLTSRGTHAWADNQDYFQLLFAPFHYLPAPHYWLLVSHSLAIWACGPFAFLYLRRQGWIAVLVAAVVWFSPQLVNMNIDLFHTEAWATILLLVMFWGASRGRRGWFYAGAVLALACKEDVAITVGAFMALALLRPSLFRLGRRDFAIGLALAVVVFVVNQGVVLPYYKARTCEWLDAEVKAPQAGATPANPWFADVGSQFLNPEWYRGKLGHPRVPRYLLLLLAPVAPFAWHAFPLVLLPLAGGVVNLIGSGYLIEATYHYDHSTFAAAIMVMLVGLGRMRWKKSVGSLLLAGVVAVHLWMPTVIRIPVKAVFGREFWEIRKDARTLLIERLGTLLPRDIVISTDYTAINYLLPGRHQIYMFENPFRPDYFGIYGLCDGVEGRYRTVPRPDLVLYREGYNTWPEVQRQLEAGYERWRLVPSFEVWLDPRGARYARLRRILEEVGAVPRPG